MNAILLRSSSKTLLVLAHLSLALLVTGFASSCKKELPAGKGKAASMKAGKSAPTMQPAANKPSAVKGTVQETMDVSSYTYARITDAKGAEIWIAGPKTALKVGQALELAGGQEMRNFKSPTLKKTFERLIMVNSFGGAGGSLAKNDPHAAMAGKKNPHGAGGMAAAMGGKNPHGAMGGKNPHGGMAGVMGGKKGPGGMPKGMASANAAADAAAPIAAGSIPKAEGANGKTVADVYAEAKALAGKPVAIRGKVVKVSKGIMGYNWFHIQDGSGDKAARTHDLTVTSDALVEKGSTVLVTGTVAADKDFGAGYRYAVIVEKASFVTVTP
jgi:hypothetical protein